MFNDENVVHSKPELIEDGSHPAQAPRPLVSIVAYALMDNHVHFLLQQHGEDGIARFMHRLGVGYTKYFNRRYERTGVLFESAYKSVLVEDDEQFLHLSRYIHLNPVDLFEEEDRTMIRLLSYPWSSLRHYLGQTKDPIVRGDILSSAMSQEDYFDFVRGWIPLRTAKPSFDSED